LVEIMIVVAIIGLLAAIAIPNFVRARVTSQKNACIENLRQIDSAKQEWALDTRRSGTATPLSRDIRPYLARGTRAGQPTCPTSTSTNLTASYYIGNLTETPYCLLVTNHVLPLN
jgi:type II secretory pathway pseudopilin PulG